MWYHKYFLLFAAIPHMTILCTTGADIAWSMDHKVNCYGCLAIRPEINKNNIGKGTLHVR